MGEEKQVGFENSLNAKNRSPVYTPGISERRGSTSSFYHADSLGSTRNITGSTQTSTDTMLTDAFGNSLSRTGTNPTPFLFAGEHQYQADSQSGLMLLGNRYYDPEAGRFISKDPIKDGDNWYAYCENNPLKYVDPMGLETYSLGGGGSGIVGVFAGWFDLQVYWDRGTGDFGVGGHIGIGVGAGLGGSLGVGGGWSPGSPTQGWDPGIVFGGLAGIGPGFTGSVLWGDNGIFSGLGGGAKIGPTVGGGVYVGKQTGYNISIPGVVKGIADTIGGVRDAIVNKIQTGSWSGGLLPW